MAGIASIRVGIRGAGAQITNYLKAVTHEDLTVEYSASLILCMPAAMIKTINPGRQFLNLVSDMSCSSGASQLQSARVKELISQGYEEQGASIICAGESLSLGLLILMFKPLLLSESIRALYGEQLLKICADCSLHIIKQSLLPENWSPSNHSGVHP